MRFCEGKGCERMHYARGWCYDHYRRNYWRQREDVKERRRKYDRERLKHS